MLRRTFVAALLLLRRSNAANSIIPTNSTIADGSVLVQLVVSSAVGALPPSNVLPLSPAAQDVQSSQLQGTAFLANANNQLSISSSSIVFISCDASTTNIDALNIYDSATRANAAGIVFYSSTSNWCEAQPLNSLNYHYVFTMTTQNDTTTLLYGLTNRAVAWNIGIGGPRTNGSDSSTTMAVGPSPGATLAMIILYAVTGTITALFITIIVVGTIRAHRHPERYGPRTVNGRIKQTRAAGLARAMLETIPVVKFGERTALKPDDIELGQGAGERLSEQESEKPQAVASAIPSSSEEIEGGIAAASGITEPIANGLGCSICTEDFEVGQDQRVLPCDHRFHPACIDPWLLNVSGTCPMCRVDLRAQEEGEEERDETAVPESATEQAAARRRRRSVLLAITGLRRPDGMSREERIQALRQYQLTSRREEPQAEVRTAPPSTGAAETDVIEREEARTGRRLRRVFNVQTWRTQPRS